jgi:hypothetical protein
VKFALQVRGERGAAEVRVVSPPLVLAFGARGRVGHDPLAARYGS